MITWGVGMVIDEGWCLEVLLEPTPKRSLQIPL